MATLASIGGGSNDSFKVTLLASLTSIPTSSTAIGGTENWNKYDAIYFECFMHYSDANDKSVFTNLILTKVVSIGARYQLLRVSTSYGNSDEVNALCYFSENVINVHVSVDGKYGNTKLNIYGVKF